MLVTSILAMISTIVAGFEALGPGPNCKHIDGQVCARSISLSAWTSLGCASVEGPASD